MLKYQFHEHMRSQKYTGLIHDVQGQVCTDLLIIPISITYMNTNDDLCVTI